MLIFYTTEDGRNQIQLRAENQTVWLTQMEMAELFNATKQNISFHLKNIFQDGELDSAATVKESLTVQAEGGSVFKIKNKRVGQPGGRRIPEVYCWLYEPKGRAGLIIRPIFI